MENRDLQAFLALAQTLHFANAAKASHMTPSTLTRLIKRLEQEVGKPLFVRDKRSVQLTWAGEQFRDYAKAQLESWQRLQHGLSHSDVAALTGSISLYCSVTASYSVLADVLPKLRSQLPGLEVQLHTGDQAQALPRILTEQDDFSIAATMGEADKAVAQQILAHTEFKLIAPALETGFDAELAAGDFAKVPFVVPEQGLTRQQLHRWWRKRHIEPTIYASVSGHEAVVAMVALGFGVALVPDVVVKHSPVAERLRVLAVDDLPAGFDIALCVLRSRLDNPLLSAVWQLVQKLDLPA